MTKLVILVQPGARPELLFYPSHPSDSFPPGPTQIYTQSARGEHKSRLTAKRTRTFVLSHLMGCPATNLREVSPDSGTTISKPTRCGCTRCMSLLRNSVTHSRHLSALNFSLSVGLTLKCDVGLLQWTFVVKFQWGLVAMKRVSRYPAGASSVARFTFARCLVRVQILEVTCDDA